MSALRRCFAVGGAVISTAMLTVGCAHATPRPLRVLQEEATRATEKARALGARSCAPEELALAEAHLRFAALERRNGDQARAQEHLALAELNARAAVILTGAGCGAAVVLPPELTLRPSRLERDADGPQQRAHDAMRNCAQVHASHPSATTLGRQRDLSAVDPRVEAASPRPPT